MERSRKISRSPRPQAPTRPGPARPFARIAQARGTAANLIYAALREDIVSMRLSPGQPINEKQLALDHGVSRTPVREALLKLAGEHLVDIFPQSGTFVARIPIAALPEALMVRKALEDLTVRLAAQKATAEQVVGFRSILDEQLVYARRGEGLKFHAADQKFHAAIAEAAGHPNVWRLVLQVKVQVDRYCLLTLPAPGRMKILVQEHAAIVDAIAAHDADKAAAAMFKHLDWLRGSIHKIDGLNRDFFDLPPEWLDQ